MKKYWIWAGVLLALFAALLVLAPKAKTRYEQAHIQPEAVFSASMERMATLNSFGYAIHSTFRVQDREEVMSDITGERKGGNVHIRGEMVKSPIDIFYLDGIIYNYDEIAQKWMVIESDTGSAAELYINELNPLIYLDFRENGMDSAYEFGELDGKNCLIAKGKPMMRSELLDSIWQDFACTLWMDYEENLVYQVHLTAVNRNNPASTLDITASFDRFDEEMELTPPDITKKKPADEEKE